MNSDSKHITFTDRNITNRKIWFDKLFREFYTPLCRFSLTIVPYDSLAEEAVQNVFVHLWEKRNTIEITNNVKGFLYQSVYHESIRLRKRRLKLKEYQLEYINQLLPTFDDLDNSERKQLKQAINRAIASLPEKCRDIFIMRRQEGLTNKEIAEYLGVSVKTVENQITIAIKKLRKELSPYIKHLPILLLFLEIS